MHVNGFKEKWIEVFARAGIELDIAQEEFAEWVSGLDGELDNEYTQNELSVIIAAEEAIEELSHARRL
jgi:NOL1/NOP2/fmu family ribosome biogenesis protein